MKVVNVSVKPIVYCFWTGTNPMSEDRMLGLQSMRENIRVSIDFIDSKEIEKRIGLNNLHPAYQYLSNTHKSDYLRCYFMHHFGGGYADIKRTSPFNNWKEQFDLINNDPNIEVIGQAEFPTGSPIPEFNYLPYFNMMLSNGWFICRQKTEFTSKWFQRVNEVLDSRFEELKKNPATDPFGGPNYPLRWAEVQGEIFHRLLYELHDEKKIRNTLVSGGMLWIPYR